jgi:hypothetical protein
VSDRSLQAGASCTTKRGGTELEPYPKAFLGAAAACAEDNAQIHGDPVASWAEFARFLDGGKTYE